MPLTRRQTITGLGLLASGSGINTVSAYSTVDASRGVTFGFTDDADAYLGMQAARNPDFLSVTDDGDGIVIEINGINEDARSRIGDILELTNNGTNTITDISVTVDDQSHNAALEVDAGGLENAQLSPGESAVGLDLIVDNRRSAGHDGRVDIQGSVTITVETDA